MVSPTVTKGLNLLRNRLESMHSALTALQMITSSNGEVSLTVHAGGMGLARQWSTGTSTKLL